MKTKRLAFSLFAACMLVLTACGSSTKIVEDNPKFATMPDVPPMVELHAAEGQTIQGLTSLVVRSPYAMQQALTAWAQVNNRPVPKSGSQAWAEAFRDISLGLVDLGKGATPWLAQAYTVKQWADVLTNIKPTVTTTTNTTTTSGDTMGDNANNSGTMQTGDGRINSNDATATPTVVTQPAPVIVQPQVVEPTVVQVPDSGSSSQ